MVRNADQRLIPEIPAGSDALLWRARLMSRIVHQVNANTRTINPPRQRAFDRPASEIQQAAFVGDTGEEGENTDPETPDQPFVQNETWWEIAKQTQNVRVENPDDSDQYVIIQRRVSSLFVKSDGSVATLIFDNS